MRREDRIGEATKFYEVIRIHGIGSPTSVSIYSVSFNLITPYFLYFSHNFVIKKCCE